MKTVLFITNRLPGGAGGRAGRFESRVRLLEEDGWDVIVGHVPDTDPRGLIEGTLRCVRLAREHDVDVVDSINNPPHLHVVGWLTSLLTGTPWVAEFLDSIATNTGILDSAVSVRLRRALEWVVLHQADRVGWVDGVQIEDDYFTRRYPRMPPERIRKLGPLGYEQSKFERADAAEFESFTITYAGSFYEDWIEPFAFLEGLTRFVKDNPSADVTVKFYGGWSEDYQRACERLGVAEVVEVHDFVPQEEAIPVLKGSDLLLVVGGDDPNDRLSLYSKTSDYVGARRPVLGVVDESFYLAETIRETGIGIAVSPNDPDRIADAIGHVYGGSFEYSPDDSVFERFSLEHRIEKLAALFVEAIGDGSSR